VSSSPVNGRRNGRELFAGERTGYLLVEVRPLPEVVRPERTAVGKKRYPSTCSFKTDDYGQTTDLVIFQIAFLDGPAEIGWQAVGLHADKGKHQPFDTTGTNQHIDIHAAEDGHYVKVLYPRTNDLARERHGVTAQPGASDGHAVTVFDDLADVGQLSDFVLGQYSLSGSHFTPHLSCR